MTLISAPEPAHTSGHTDNETTDALDALFDRPVRVKFWVCPDHNHGRVEWTGNQATCLECGRANEASPACPWPVGTVLESRGDSGIFRWIFERSITGDWYEVGKEQRHDWAYVASFPNLVELTPADPDPDALLVDLDRARAELAEVTRERDQARAEIKLLCDEIEVREQIEADDVAAFRAQFGEVRRG